MAALTKASFLQDPSKTTPVFVRFSTVAGSRGSTDLARDVRGFAVKFYTDEGIFDLVGNNIPVFFIQDAMKFPDLDPCGEAGAAQRDAAGGIGARHLLGLHLADARVDAHDHVGHVRPGDSAQPADDGRLRHPHLPLRQREGEVALREVPLEAAARHALGGVGRGAEDLRQGPRFPSPRPVGGDRERRLSRNGNSASRSSRRRTSTSSTSTCSIRPSSSRRSSCRCSGSAG